MDQWILGILPIAVTLVLAFFGWWKWWLVRELDSLDTKIDQEKLDYQRRTELSRSEVFTQAARAETMAARSSAEVARLELKMAEQRNEYMLKSDFERAMDRYFDPLFLRLDTLEKRQEQFVASLIKHVSN